MFATGNICHCFKEFKEVSMSFRYCLKFINLKEMLKVSKNSMF